MWSIGANTDLKLGAQSPARSPQFLLCLTIAGGGHSGAHHNGKHWICENNMNVKQRYKLKRLATANTSRVSSRVNFLTRARDVVAPVNIFLWSSLIAMQNLVAVSYRVDNGHMLAEPNFFWRRWGSVSFRGGVADPTLPFPYVLPYRIWSF